METQGGECRSCCPGSEGLIPKPMYGDPRGNYSKILPTTDGAKKQYLLLLLRISDSEYPSCTCPIHSPSQRRGRTMAPLGAVLLGGRSPSSWPSLPSTPMGVLLPLSTLLQNSPKSLQCLCSKRGILEPSGTADK